MKDMRKIILAAISVAVIGGAVWVGVFYYQNLRGMGPAVRAPGGDIAELLRHPERSEGSPTNVGDRNADPATAGRDPSTTLRSAQDDKLVGPLKLPPGFSISVFAKDLDKPRVIVEGPRGD